MKFTFNKGNQNDSIIDPLGNTQVKNYDQLNRLDSWTSPEGGTINYQFDKGDRLIGVKDANGDSVSYSFTLNDKIDKIIFGDGREVSGFKFDALRRVIESPDPLTKFGYNQTGKVDTIIDANNDTTRIIYDLLDRDSLVIYQGKDTVEKKYNENGLLKSVKDKTGEILFYYNPKNQLDSIVCPSLLKRTMKDIIKFQYDGFKRIAMILPNGKKIEYKYNDRNRLDSIVFDGKAIVFGYTRTGLVKSITYPNKLKTNYWYTKSTRLDSLKIADSTNKTVYSELYQYDKNGNKTQILKQFPDRITSVSVDSSSYRQSDTLFICSNSGFENYMNILPLAASYKAPIVFTNPQSIKYSPETEFAIDSIIKPKHAFICGDYFSITENVEWQIKRKVITTERIYGRNRLAVADSINKRFKSREGSSRKAILVNAREPYSAIAVSSFASNLKLPIILSYPDSLFIETLAALNGVDSVITFGDFSQIIDTLEKHDKKVYKQFNSKWNQNIIDLFCFSGLYQKNKLVITEKSSYQSLTQRVNDFVSQDDYILIADSTQNYASMIDTITRRTYKESNFRIDSVVIINSENLKPSITYDVNHIYNYIAFDTLKFAYDKMNQLISESSYLYPKRNYKYNPNYNRDTLLIADTLNAVYKYNGWDRLEKAGSTTLTYYNTGHLKTKVNDKDSLYFHWSPRGRLDSIFSLIHGVIIYKYDALNRRYSIITSKDTTYTLFGDDLDAILDIKNGDSTLYISGFGIDDIYSIIDKSGDYYFLKDALGTNVGLSDFSGVVKEINMFDGFGVCLTDSITKSRFAYTGREKEIVLNLYYYRSRFYDTESGRFLSIDPKKGTLNDLISLNKYNYVRNNGLNYKDPLGTDWWNPIDLWNGGSQFVDGAIKGTGEFIGGAVKGTVETVSNLIPRSISFELDYGPGHFERSVGINSNGKSFWIASDYHYTNPDYIIFRNPLAILDRNFYNGMVFGASIEINNKNPLQSEELTFRKSGCEIPIPNKNLEKIIGGVSLEKTNNETSFSGNLGSYTAGTNGNVGLSIGISAGCYNNIIGHSTIWVEPTPPPAPPYELFRNITCDQPLITTQPTQQVQSCQGGR